MTPARFVRLCRQEQFAIDRLFRSSPSIRRRAVQLSMAAYRRADRYVMSHVEQYRDG